ncbi:MAG TPA: ribonuclease HI family protein [Thermomicrobiales bacterium]|nr:ribonuclease HI family protein [Thermomicrobiales bacterium]
MRRAPATPPTVRSQNVPGNRSPDTSRYCIVFDGGSLGNPGKGYGSYEITLGDAVVRHHREDYGDRVTNNQAEYLTLIRALQWLLESTGDAAGATRILVNGDSQLVLNQLMGRWKVKNEGLRVLYEQASRLITRFKDVELVWHPRAKSVERLGH